MIVYDLKCRDGHQFEAWFRDSGAYDAQVEAGEVRCPVCGCTNVQKALMAPNLSRGEASAPAAQEDQGAAEARRALLELRRQVESNCDYVGARFPEEARRIHYGESDRRGIYGETTSEEAEALKEEGVEVQRIPWLPPENA
ncbi:MAG: DUF1178 family protein [Rhodospirillales bacterium]|nr:DUF1178 family protein [Rhodospirillales bacterium]MDH3912644.1 DUF1178 family protein [Rhodospirillales bacterium]MDH3965624.1 DUF1178 family protein [Rhodospirillales bacterium]